MSKNLTVAPEVLRDSANELKNKVSSVKGNLDDVTIEVNKVPNSYVGTASEQFIDKYNQMKSKFDSFYQVIEEYANFLIKTADTYQETDETLKKQAEDFLA